jgi:HK97 family phage major capsid protein
MSSLLDSLTQRREALVAQTTELAQTASKESRQLTVDEATKFDAMIAEVEAIDGRRSAIAEGEKRAREIEESFVPKGERPVENTGERGLAQWARSARVGDGYDLLPVQGAERRAINAFRENRAMSYGAGSGLGKDGVYGQLWEYAVQGSQILQAGVDIISTADGNALPMPVVTAHASANNSVAANAPITAADAAMTVVDLSVSKYGYITYVPTELVQDATFDLDGYLARAAGRALGNQISLIAHNAVTAGYTVSGATAASATVGATGSVFSDAIITLFHSVLPEYRSTSSFLMSDPTAAGVRKTKDPLGRYLWETALVNGNPDLILGKSVYVDSALQGPDVGTAKIIYFGDFNSLKVRIAGGIRFERSAEVGFANDQIAYRAIVRTGAVALDPNAVKFLQLTAT